MVFLKNDGGAGRNTLISGAVVSGFLNKREGAQGPNRAMGSQV